jgi:hypothetical protein
MKTNICALLALLLLSATPEISAQTSDPSDELLFRKFRVTLVPGLSTNGLNAPSYSAKYSLNIIAGNNGGLDGYELGLININQRYVRGFQTGLLNISGGEMSGVSFAGIMSIAGQEMSGLQGAGVINISQMNMSGLQAAGSANITGGNMEGLQVSGGLNIARSRMEGLQATGGMNIARHGEGLQIAGAANISRSFEGLQVSGFFNYADQFEGVQIGVLNIARDFDGVPLGLVSLYGNGRKNLDLWVNEAGFVNAGFKTGTHEIYNMLSVGYNMGITDRDVLSLGWTIGRHRTLTEAWLRPGLDDYFVNADLSFTKIIEGDNLEGIDKLNNQFTWRYMMGRTVGDNFSVYAGPSLNVLVSEDVRNADYAPYSLLERSTSNYDVRGWIGFTVGMQLF